MNTSQLITAARELLSNHGGQIIESMLLRSDHYIGRKFRFDGGHAIWECGDPRLSIYNRDGKLVKRITLIEEQRQAA